MSRAARPLILLALSLGAASGAAQAPKLGDVVERIGRYVTEYGTRLASVVAEETYRQEISARTAAALGMPARRTLRSDYVLTRLDGRGSWVGYRDTFEVDGRPVRDHEGRLQQLIASGALAQAARIADQNSRYNLGTRFFPRNVNVPTFALDLLSDTYRDRFGAQRIGTEVVDGRVAWIIDFRERQRPTIVRTSNGRDRLSRIQVVADPETGEVLRTTASWDQMVGSIVVEYGHVAGISAPVPLTMSERLNADDEAIGIRGDATYTNYRQFRTDGRLIAP